MAKGKVLKTIIDISGEISPTLGKTIEGVTDKLEGVNVKALAVGAAITAVGGAVVAGVSKATKYLAELGTEYDQAANQMAASTGLVGDELANLESVMQGVYSSNFGESFEDAANAVAEVYKQTGLLGDALEATTEGAFALSDTFGYDITESARAAKAMMTNFGVSGEEAMSLIAAGAQNGLDYSGELIDSINEYSVQFAKLGFAADDMFHIFQQGAESGAWNLDKVGDAIKEFSIRAIDGSDSTTEAFKSLGMDAEDMMEIFAAGGDEASAAFQDVVNALIDMDDQVQRDALGVALFGTMWEDLGVDAVAALADISDGAYDTENALEKINSVKYDDLDSAMEGIKRKAEVALVPAAQKVTDAFISIAPKVESAITAVSPYITALAEQIGPLIENVISLGEQGFGFVAEKVGELAPVVSDFVQNGIVFLKDNMDTLLPIVSGLTAAFAAYKAIMLATTAVQKIKAALDAKQLTMTGFLTAAQSALGAAMTAVNWPIALIAVTIGAVVAAIVVLIQHWDEVEAAAKKLGKYLEKIWKGIKDKITKTFKQIGSTISKTWDNIKSTTAKIWNNIKASISDIWTAIKTSVSNAVNNVKTTISNVWEKIKSTTSSVWNSIKSTISNIWSSIKSSVSNAINSVKTTVSTVWETIKTTTATVWETIKTTISTVWETIKTTVKTAVDNVKQTVSDVFGSLLAIMRAPFDSIVNIIDWVVEKVNSLLNKIRGVKDEAGGINVPGYATGGFTNGISIVGEDPRYPTEAVISFNPAYRTQNLSYWAQAGRMLGANTETYSISAASGGGSTVNLGGITFAPNITITGHADKGSIMEAIEAEYPEFIDLLDEYFDRRGVTAYV